MVLIFMRGCVICLQVSKYFFLLPTLSAQNKRYAFSNVSLQTGRELWGGVAPKVHKLMCISASRRCHNELGPKGFFEFI